MPFQLACPGPDQYSDTCESATVYELELEAGDVILLATDGVLDNMWDEQIAHVIHKCLGVSLTPPPPTRAYTQEDKEFLLQDSASQHGRSLVLSMAIMFKCT